MNLTELNKLSADDAEATFEQCCAATRWMQGMADARPYQSVEHLKEAAHKVWSRLGEDDFLQAFEAHPMIGDVNSLREKYSNTKAIAAGEQSSVDEATDEVIAELAKLNHEYFDIFGFIFIVCATGKTAAEMLALLKARIDNDRADEVQNAAVEQAKITAIRIDKMLVDCE